MPAIRLIGRRGLAHEEISGGDTLLVGDTVTAVAGVPGQVIPATALIAGYAFRSGPTAAYTDTLDTAANILTALSGNLPGNAGIVGNSFKARIINSVAFIQTVTLGAGMIAGLGTIATVAVSSFRDFLFTFVNEQLPVSLVCATNTGNNLVVFQLPANLAALPMGPNPGSVNIMPGASVTGVGIPAGTVVLGLVQGQGGLLGVTLSQNATVTNTLGVQLTFGPTLKVDGLGSGLD